MGRTDYPTQAALGESHRSMLVKPKPMMIRTHPMSYERVRSALSIAEQRARGDSRFQEHNVP